MCGPRGRMFSFSRVHGMTFLVVGMVLVTTTSWKQLMRFRYYNRRGAIQSTGRDITENLPHFMVMLLCLQRMGSGGCGSSLACALMRKVTMSTLMSSHTLFPGLKAYLASSQPLLRHLPAFRTLRSYQRPAESHGPLSTSRCPVSALGIGWARGIDLSMRIERPP